MSMCSILCFSPVVSTISRSRGSLPDLACAALMLIAAYGAVAAFVL